MTGLSSEQQQLFERLLAKEGLRQAEALTIRPLRLKDHDEAPLSYPQQRLLFLNQLDEETDAYNICSAMALKGALDVSVLEQALSEIVRRHNALRVRFKVAGETPVQIITPAAPVVVPLLDLRSLNEEEREREAYRLAVEEASAPFDLTTGPLLRAKVVRVEEQDQIVMLTVHHIASDGWSLGVLIREIGVLYEAYSKGEESPLEELPIQYTDYAAWQREWLRGEALEEQLKYWKETLGSGLEGLELPTDHPRGAATGRRGGSEAIELSRELSEKLRELSRREGTTLFMTLLAGFKALLHRYSGQEEIVVGTPIANRNHSELEGLIGCFINALALRTKVEGEASYREILRRVRETSIGAYAHQDLPFEALVEGLGVKRDLSVSPLFQVVFALQNAMEETLRLGDLKQSTYAVESRASKYDLMVMTSEGAEGIKCWAEYDRDLFEPETIRRMLRHYEHLLGEAANEPEKRISMLRLEEEEEERRSLRKWNETEREYGEEKWVHELFEEQAERMGERTALIYEGEELSYRELNARAEGIASRLREEGVGEGDLIGIYLERSLEMVTGLMGILKAGGAYLPLDPSYPAERIAYMLEDSGARVLLTSGKGRSSPPSTEAKTICVEEVGEERGRAGGKRPAAESLAYVIYTSGSTGKPKGTMNTHRGLRNRLLWMQGEYRLDDSDVVLQKTPFSFDVSVWEFFWPLITGARLVLAKPEGHKDPKYLVGLIKEQAVTTLHFVPSMLEVFLEAEGLEQCDCVRRVICSGEALSTKVEARFFERIGAELHNLYGPTETAIDVSYWKCQRGAKERVVPIGRPIANTQLYLLDKNLAPAPVGIPGEVHIAGTNLGRGYFNRPDLTADRFIPNPFAREAGARMYKTGDLARRRPDGVIEYLRRIDQQVKVRGFRIELGEVESALLAHPQVRDAVALVRIGEQTGGELTSYIVPAPGTEPTTDELQGFLKQRLPEYAVPSVFVRIDAVPLSPNGKIDRKSLSSMGAVRLKSAEPYLAPRTVVEEILAAIWKQALGIEQVGVHDNFFAIGGDSIRSIRVLALAKDRGLLFTLQNLFQRQTIAELAKDIQWGPTRPAPEIGTEPFCLCPVEDRYKLPADVIDAYPLTKLQAGMLYHIELRPDTPMFHNINSVRLRGAFDADKFQEAAQAVADRHPVLRTSFRLTEYSEPLQLVHSNVRLRVIVEDLRRLSPGEQEAVLRDFFAAEKSRPFDLTCAPLMRLYVHRLTDEIFRFTTAECHAILDGWSYTSTVAEIFERYSALRRPEPPPLKPPPSVSFSQFVALERMAIESEEHRSYWEAKIKGGAPLKFQPRPFLHRENGFDRIHELDFPIPSEIIAGLNRLAQAASAPLKSVLLAAHVKVMSLLSGTQDVITGLSTNGRPEENDGEEVRGLFLNTAPFRLKPREGSWRDLVRQTFDAELELTPFRRYPLSEVQKQWGREPLIETAFNFVHFHVVEKLLRAGEIELLEYGDKSEESNFSLLANFHMGVGSSSPPIILRVNFDTTRFCLEQMKCVEEYYRRVLEEIAEHPEGAHAEFDFPRVLSAQENALLEKATNIDELEGDFLFPSTPAALA